MDVQGTLGTLATLLPKVERQSRVTLHVYPTLAEYPAAKVALDESGLYCLGDSAREGTRWTCYGPNPHGPAYTQPLCVTLFWPADLAAEIQEVAA